MAEIDTGTEELLARVDEGVAVLTMNRPQRRNALSPTMLAALGRMLARLEVDDDVGCVVLTGAGGAFCAGGDVKEMAAPSGGGPAGHHGRADPSPAARPTGDLRAPVRDAQADRRARCPAPPPGRGCPSLSPATCAMPPRAPW